MVVDVPSFAELGCARSVEPAHLCSPRFPPRIFLATAPPRPRSDAKRGSLASRVAGRRIGASRTAITRA